MESDPQTSRPVDLEQFLNYLEEDPAVQDPEMEAFREDCLATMSADPEWQQFNARLERKRQRRP